MSNMANRIERARNVLAHNRYLVLSTHDEEGPWAAALAFVVVKPFGLAFVSPRDTRHSRAITSDHRVSGVIYDSTVDPAKAESLQFAGQASLLSDRDLEYQAAMEAFTTKSGAPPDLSVPRDHPRGIYLISLHTAYVLDQDAWTSENLDAREPIDVALLISGDGGEDRHES